MTHSGMIDEKDLINKPLRTLYSLARKYNPFSDDQQKIRGDYLFIKKFQASQPKSTSAKYVKYKSDLMKYTSDFIEKHLKLSEDLK